MSPLAAFYESQFNASQTNFPSWFSKQQADAFRVYQQQGLPTRKTEQWKYASLEALKNFDGLLGQTSVIEDETLNCIVIENGVISIPTNLPEGVQILTLSDALMRFKEDVDVIFASDIAKQAHCFEHVNLALLSEGLFIHVEKNSQVTQPLNIEINTTDSNVSQHFQHMILVEEGAAIELVERFTGDRDAAYFNNHVSQFIVKDNACLKYVKLIEESDAAQHIGKTNAYVSRNANVECHSFAISGAMIRSDLNADLMGEGSHISMNGLYLSANKQNVAHYTKVNHLCPHATSDEVYKGILGGQSKGVFNGSIFVAKDAQKTDASQQNKNLLLSPKAEVNTKPQLEIYADDVKCAHGATIGQLDDNELFYLQSRGIPKEAAMSLLVKAFAGDLIEKLASQQHTNLKERLHCQLEKHLRQAYEV